MKFIFGKKIGMSQVFSDDRKVIPVTLIETESCVVTQIKTEGKDGYQATQVGFGEKKKINKPLAGHLKSLGNFRHLREIRESEDLKCKVGDKIDISVFEEGDKIKVIGTSKGKGFQGVMKRHGFHGSPASHGHKHDHRAPGSIGSAFPEHVFKGKKMAGRMGSDRVTVKGLKVIKIDKENNLLIIKGAVPGRIGSVVRVESL